MVTCQRATDASRTPRFSGVGCCLDLFSDSRGQEVSHRTEEPSSNLLGMRSVLPRDLARLRQRLGARAAPRRAVRRRLAPVGPRPAGQRRRTLQHDVAIRGGRTPVAHRLQRSSSGASAAERQANRGAPSERAASPRNAKPREDLAGLFIATQRGACRRVVAGFGVGVPEALSIGLPSLHDHGSRSLERLQLTPFLDSRQEV